MKEALLIILAIVPGLLICWWMYRADRYEPEKRVDLLKAFLLGAVITLPAYGIQYLAHQKGLDQTSQIFWTLFTSFIIVALSEEAMKVAGFMGFIFPQRAFNEPLDGIVYAVFLNMGFATVENLLYAFRFSDWTNLLVRAFTAVPAHAVFGILAGYYLGLAKFRQDQQWKLVLKGLFIAIAVHGTYDFFILLEAMEGLAGLALVALAMAIYYGRKMIQTHQQQSPFNPSETDFP